MKTIILPLERADLTERTFRVLSDKILKREFKPGEKISVEQVVASLGVS